MSSGYRRIIQHSQSQRQHLMSNAKDFYDTFVEYWAIPVSVVAVIIAMIVNYFMKEENNE